MEITEFIEKCNNANQTPTPNISLNLILKYVKNANGTFVLDKNSEHNATNNIFLNYLHTCKAKSYTEAQFKQWYGIKSYFNVNFLNYINDCISYIINYIENDTDKEHGISLEMYPNSIQIKKDSIERIEIKIKLPNMFQRYDNFISDHRYFKIFNFNSYISDEFGTIDLSFNAFLNNGNSFNICTFKATEARNCCGLMTFSNFEGYYWNNVKESKYVSYKGTVFSLKLANDLARISGFSAVQFTDRIENGLKNVILFKELIGARQVFRFKNKRMGSNVGLFTWRVKK